MQSLHANKDSDRVVVLRCQVTTPFLNLAFKKLPVVDLSPSLSFNNGLLSPYHSNKHPFLELS